MNCETCELIFMRLSELKRHAACEKHKEQVTYDFSCLPCSLPLHNISDVIEHIESEEHSVMSLAADNPYDKMVEISGTPSQSFPSLYFCMLCSCRDGSPYGIHLQGVIHKNIARLMRDIIRNKTIHYTNDGCEKQLFEKLKTRNGPIYCELCNRSSSNWYTYKQHLNSTIHLKAQVFMNKLINVKQNAEDAYSYDFCSSFSLVCGLCNIHFNSHESYAQHMENKTHKRVEQFLSKISYLVKNMDVVIRDFDMGISETFSNSLPPLYYCELCELFCFESQGYANHLNGFIHKRIEELFSKLSDKRKGNVIHLYLNRRDSEKFNAHYCKLCVVGFSEVSDYGLHLNDKGHFKIERFINSLTTEGDKCFINLYIDAQIQMMFGNSPPPNYCVMCNILHSKPEKYEQHLVTEHNIDMQSHLKNSSFANENPSKRLKKSPQLTHDEALDNIQGERVLIKSNSYFSGEVHQQTEPSMIKTTFGYEDQETNRNCPSWPGFVNREVSNNYPPLLRFGAPATGNYPPFPDYPYHHTPYGNYPPLPCFQVQEPYGYYPSLCDLQAPGINRDYPPWPGFQSRAYTTHSYCPPWQGFRAHTTRNHNPPWPGFQAYAYATNSHNPLWFGFENRDLSNICPPGKEVLENNSNCPPEHGFEDSSGQIGAEESSSNVSSNEHFCELCNYSCSNSRLYEKHLNGEKHKKLRKLLNKKNKKVCLETPISENAAHPLQYNCELCNVFNSNASQYEIHLATAKHKRNQWLLFVLMQRPL